MKVSTSSGPIELQGKLGSEIENKVTKDALKRHAAYLAGEKWADPIELAITKRLAGYGEEAEPAPTA